MTNEACRKVKPGRHKHTYTGCMRSNATIKKQLTCLAQEPGRAFVGKTLKGEFIVADVMAGIVSDQRG